MNVGGGGEWMHSVAASHQAGSPFSGHDSFAGAGARSHLYAHKTGSILYPARGISSGDPMQQACSWNKFG